MDIRNELEQLRDEKYREFGLSLLPNVDKSKMIGVRLPQLRAVAARIKKESPKGVMPDLPQGDMFEEKLVRGFVIAGADLPFEEHLKAAADFVPEIDCIATSCASWTAAPAIRWTSCWPRRACATITAASRSWPGASSGAWWPLPTIP